jgi:hypothetical protein
MSAPRRLATRIRFHRIRTDNLPAMLRGATGEDLDLDEDDTQRPLQLNGP